MEDSDEKFVYLLMFCETLISSKFDTSWLSGIYDEHDLIQDLALHFRNKKEFEPDPALVMAVAKGMAINVRRKEKKKECLPEESTIPSGSRNISSTLNAREEFCLFAESLTPTEISVFEWIVSNHQYTSQAFGVVPSLRPESAIGTKFFDKPSAAMIAEIALALHIGEHAASKRLARIRKKYFLFRHEILDSSDLKVTFNSDLLDRLANEGLVDECKWVSFKGAAILLDLREQRVISRCNRGALIGYRHEKTGDWYIEPRELERWIRSGDRMAMDYKAAMAALNVGWRNGQFVRRAGWASPRGLGVERELAGNFSVTTSNLSPGQIQNIVADCLYTDRFRNSYEWSPYHATPEDMATTDWVGYKRRSAPIQ